jgi:hypothetical protein
MQIMRRINEHNKSASAICDFDGTIVSINYMKCEIGLIS